MDKTDQTAFFQSLWTCLTGDEIAHRPEFHSIRQELKSLISAPATVYATLYEMTLLRLMEFCQAMPHNMEQPIPYSLLTTALETAIAALKVRRGVMLPRHSNSETVAEQEPLWTYAVFTASLWVQLPDLQADRTIELYKNEQIKIGCWHPLAGNLYEPQTFYKIMPQPHPIIINSTACLAGCLARIIPTVACRWLTSNKKVWSAWWEVVTQTISPHNELGQLIQKVLPENRLIVESTESTVNVSSTTPTSNPDPSENNKNNSTISTQNEKMETHSTEPESKTEPTEKELHALEDLNQWVLHHCSAQGKLNGKKQFMRIPSGLLIRESSLKTFIKENSEYESVDSVLKLLDRYLKKEGESAVFRYHFVHDSAEDIIQGIILKSSSLCESLKNQPENQFIQQRSETT